jgi:hypothetical protein
MASTERGPYSFSANWSLGTGFPFTRPFGYDETFDYRFAIQSIPGNRGDTRMIVDKPYLGRLPIVHRLDVAVQRGIDLPFGRLEGHAGVINSYNRRNMFYYDIFSHRRVDQLPIAPYAALRLEVQ